MNGQTPERSLTGVTFVELCNYVIITIAALLKIENWASGVMFDRPSSMLTGKDVVSHSSSVILANILFILSL